MKIFSVKKEIIENKKISAGCYRITFESRKIACMAKPGQFLHIKCSDTYDPLLRRPISIHSVENNVIEILYKVVGRGTGLLSEKSCGDSIDVMGPLGNGFDYQSLVTCHLSPILVGGGIGIAPLYFLARKLVEKYSNVTVLIGADAKHNILCVDKLKKLGCRVKVSTNDGSTGINGTVVNLLKKELSPENVKLKIFACGPIPMLKQINRLVSVYNVSSQVSLEKRMACGIGACMGCIIKVKNGYKRVCKDGPVFDIKEVIWEDL
ncbi:dihydroorotate dehydrogenase electron transfer subunit [bacterium]|nr:dihydroorotate dehydrogenase electron transfer subunit [bacterium]